MTDPARPLLEMDGVAKRHRRRGPWVLDGVSLSVAAGEVVQIVAGNGGGKSTLLRIAAGLQPPTHGHVHVAGERRYVPEQAPVPPSMTVRSYLGHQARLQGVAADGVGAWVEATIGRHGLGPVADRPMGRLSKGWGQRCLLAQAFGGHGAGASLVLLDEPWTGVDDASREHLVAVVADHAGGGAAVLLSSHEAVALPGMRRLGLRDGRLAPLGATVSVTTVRTVRLSGRADAPQLDGALTSAAGVLSVRGHGDTREVVVTADAAGDRALVALLQRGWSIERLVTGEGP
jgi:ABC-2 type transport system ATP-binding protein